MARFELTSEKMNEQQIKSLRQLLKIAKSVHMLDVRVRINGGDEWVEADWIKHIRELPDN